ncbi:MAG: aminoacyl-tRNA hydrolase [Deltaproteobacteria bacterium]|nr:aminoacyl-tRNA hydrolase [Deltaproteobacteria bacterium]
MWLVVGLGNPGPKYAQNRHNIGFMVADEIARRLRVGAFRAKLGGEVAQGQASGQKLLLLKPMEYMNESGRAVQRMAAFYQVSPERIVVIHDDVDLELGRLKLKQGGGHGGHNGVRSTIDQLGSSDFVRIRCGVGHPQEKEKVVGHVLGDFSKAEREAVDALIQRAADAALDVVTQGVLFAMNRHNVWKKEVQN